jgi:chromosome segregation ATPase
VEEALASKVEEAASLSARLESLQQQFESTSADASGTANIVADLRAQMEAKAAEFDISARQLEETQAKLATLSEKANEVAASIEAFSTAVGAIFIANVDGSDSADIKPAIAHPTLSACFNTIQAEVAALSQKLVAEQGNTAKQVERLDAANSKHDDLTREFSQVSVIVEQLGTALTVCGSVMQIITTVNFENEIDAIAEKIAAIDADVPRLQAIEFVPVEVVNSAVELSGWMSDMYATVRVLSADAAAAKELTTALEHAEEELAQANADKAELQERTEELQRRIDVSMQTNGELDAQRVDLEREVQFLKSMVSSAEGGQSAATSELMAAHEEAQTYKNMVDALKIRDVELVASNDATKSQLSAVNSELKTATEQLATSTASVADLERTIEALRTELAQLREVAEAFEQHKLALETALEVQRKAEAAAEMMANTVVDKV